VGTALLALHVGLAVFGPALAPYHFAQFNMLHTLEAPSRAVPGGTDQYGRDQLSRVMWGARGTLLLAAASTLLGVGLGVVVGMLGAFYRGLLDEVLMRFVDALMALPALLLAMLLLTTVGADPVYVALGIGVVFMPRSARVVRGVALSLAAAEFIDAARVRGERGLYIIFAEMLPNAWAPIIVEVTIRFAYAILLATSLGFLGLGAQPPAPDWGLMINEALPFLAQAPWLAVMPAAAISSAVVAANLLGDSLSDVLALRRRGETL
jgi:peptide/nickel transport system permease protein